MMKKSDIKTIKSFLLAIILLLTVLTLQIDMNKLSNVSTVAFYLLMLGAMLSIIAGLLYYKRI